MHVQLKDGADTITVEGPPEDVQCVKGTLTKLAKELVRDETKSGKGRKKERRKRDVTVNVTVNVAFSVAVNVAVNVAFSVAVVQ